VLYVVDAACQNRFEDVKNALGELDYPIPFLHVARMDLVGHCWWLVHVLSPALSFGIPKSRSRDCS
jgi:hypothetical protein